MPEPTRPRTPEQTALNRRKEGHLEVCLDDAVDRRVDSFSGVKLRYNALPEISREQVSTATEFGGKAVRAPIVIASMTGGTAARLIEVNRNLARGAEALGLPLGLGSMKIMLSDATAVPSFQVRDLAPSVPLIANLGLVSFNYGIVWDDVERIIDRIRPDVLALHLNALQESVQDGGDTDFRGLRKTLERIIRRCPIPVYVKECGGGIAPELVHAIAAMGAAYVDVSGSDGTSWASVEARLGGDPDFGERFRDFGLPTRWILERVDAAAIRPARLVASGGIRDGIQAVKALALGADLVSMARPFLAAAVESGQAVAALGERMIREMQNAMFLTGAVSIGRLGRHVIADDRYPMLGLG
jgi:isopentenyl-diphosphate delta-isomerase